MSKTAAIPMDKEIQSFQLIFTGQQYFSIDVCCGDRRKSSGRAHDGSG